MKIIGTLIAALAIVPLCRGAVIFPEASEKDRAAAEKYVRHHSDYLVKVGGGKEELTIGFPHFSYGVQVPNVQAGELVRAAKLYSLRHLILNDSKAIGAVELTPRRNIFGRRSFRTIGSSPLAARFVEALSS
ncbi:MAG: hypothetical protein H0X66_03310 [Verrucomicrobia bacterium]|nr:hypothetical protein [Verrucomicrobiota bacterium]